MSALRGENEELVINLLEIRSSEVMNLSGGTDLLSKIDVFITEPVNTSAIEIDVDNSEHDLLVLCDLCGVTLKETCYLHAHKMQVHENRKPHKCPNCRVGYSVDTN